MDVNMSRAMKVDCAVDNGRPLLSPRIAQTSDFDPIMRAIG